MFYLSATLSGRSISQQCTFYIFDKWAFCAQTSSSNWFKNKLLKVNFLILVPVTANEDGWEKVGTSFCRGGALIPHCVCRQLTCLQREKTESSDCLILVESPRQPASPNTAAFVKQARVKLSHTHPIKTSIFFSIRHLLWSENVYIWSEEKKNSLHFIDFRLTIRTNISGLFNSWKQRL